MSLYGHISLGPASSFDLEPGDARLEGVGGVTPVASFEVEPGDWPTYRGDNERTGVTRVAVPRRVRRRETVPATPPDSHTSPRARARPSVDTSRASLVPRPRPGQASAIDSLARARMRPHPTCPRHPNPSAPTSATSRPIAALSPPSHPRTRATSPARLPSPPRPSIDDVDAETRRAIRTVTRATVPRGPVGVDRSMTLFAHTRMYA